MFWPEILPLVHLIVEKTLSASRETSPISDGLLSAIDLLVVFRLVEISAIS